MNKYNITYIDSNGNVCIKLIKNAGDKVTAQITAWEDFIKNCEYANE